MWEYETHLELDGADKRWWDYRALFRNRASTYRLMVNCIVSLFGQWAGNGTLPYNTPYSPLPCFHLVLPCLHVTGVVSYFLSGVLGTAGVTDPVIQTDLFTAMNAVQCIFAFGGSTMVDKFGRRPMLIWVNLGCALCWVGVVAASGIQASKHDKASSAATVAMIYIFQVVYSVGWTPMQALYPVEVLSFEMRAKGMAFSGLFVNIGTSSIRNSLT